jgi:hypothetical protein
MAESPDRVERLALARAKVKVQGKSATPTLVPDAKSALQQEINDRAARINAARRALETEARAMYKKNPGSVSTSTNSAGVVTPQIGSDQRGWNAYQQLEREQAIAQNKLRKFGK